MSPAHLSASEQRLRYCAWYSGRQIAGMPRPLFPLKPEEGSLLEMVCHRLQSCVGGGTTSSPNHSEGVSCTSANAVSIAVFLRLLP
jgi:hypothetical protein